MTVATIRYIDAINSALAGEMKRDDSVIVLGEDVTLGGPFGATKGLSEEFGDDRVINTPIAEGTVMGLAAGAAMLGARPILEVMFIDFITLAMDQLVNHAAKLHYMTGGQAVVPLTIRALCGAGGGFGAHHSQSLDAWFLHVPGLKVVAPSNPADAAGLLRSAVRDNNPVLFLEHRGLYWRKAEVTEDATPVPLGMASVARQGGDLTIVAVSKMVEVALAAADDLSDSGIEAEVIDLRSIVPLDREAILASVRRTGRLVVVHEAVTFGGIGAEIAAMAQEHAFAHLVAPVQRVGAPFAPVPASVELEKIFVPGPDDVIAAARGTMTAEGVR